MSDQRSESIATNRQLLSVEMAMTAAEAVDIWTTESIGGVFPSSRLREIREAEDVLTYTEKRVYTVFWGSNDLSNDGERIVRKGYDTAAKEARVTKRILPRSSSVSSVKGFLNWLLRPWYTGSGCQLHTG